MPVPYKLMISPGEIAEGAPDAALTTDARIGGNVAEAVTLSTTGTMTEPDPEVKVTVV
jgi:hypothetical protein